MGETYPIEGKADLAHMVGSVVNLEEIFEMANIVVAVSVANKTDYDLVVRDKDHDYGGFVEDPSLIIPPNEFDVFISAWNPGPKGTAGMITYEARDPDGDLDLEAYVEWRNRLTPFRGSVARTNLRGTDSGQYQLTGHIGNDSQDIAEFELDVNGGGGSGGSGGGGSGGGSGGGTGGGSGGGHVRK